MSGNVASAFTVFLFNTNGKSASVSFATSLFNGGGYATATLSLIAQGGFNPNSIDSMTITGNQLGGTDSFRISFDNISAVPEPATYAAILATATLGLACLRRRRRSQSITAAPR